MCGITGFFDTTHSTHADVIQNLITRMSDRIQHRGPDDSGDWCNAESGIALGFRRLAILDLSATGHQPMQSADQRFVMVFNGEIYNFASLRAELLELEHSFRGTSDTEIMLAAISQWGLRPAVQRFNGMFAFALWDRHLHVLSLVRDRLGIKPLYFGWAGKTLLFGSELKALKAHPDFSFDVDRNALTLFMRHSYIPAPYTIFKGVHKLHPGCIATFRQQTPQGSEHIESYWSVREAIQNGIDHPFSGNQTEAIEALHNHLTRSIGLRMIADVPLGAFLSGGIDSSTIVALMQKQSNRPVRTFTIGFNEAGFDEASHARAVANHLRTDHTELYVSQAEARAIIPRLPTLYDEPFADPSQIPTFLVSQIARQHVTVSLSGDGGDELFAGYNRYYWTGRLWNTTGWAPASLRKWMSNGLSSVSPQAWTNFLSKSGLPNPGDKIQKLSAVMASPNPQATYMDLVSHWSNPAELVINGSEPLTPLTDPGQHIHTRSLSEDMMFLDMLTYLPDDILAKVDRASMGNSLEARAPFLDDHETVEFAWKLPLCMKIRNGKGKWILRQVLDRYVPRELIDRPKMGFGVPIDTWLRGPLRPWADALLDENQMRQQGYLHPTAIRQHWQEHQAGEKNWQYKLWNVLMFQAWLEESTK